MKTLSLLILVLLAYLMSFLLSGCSVTLNTGFGKDGRFQGGNLALSGTLPSERSLRK